jgi:hypothetical protein
LESLYSPEFGHRYIDDDHVRGFICENAEKLRSRRSLPDHLILAPGLQHLTEGLTDYNVVIGND